jgi:hypothetical protein
LEQLAAVPLAAGGLLDDGDELPQATIPALIATAATADIIRRIGAPHIKPGQATPVGQ